jgi:hypothetical protein
MKQEVDMCLAASIANNSTIGITSITANIPAVPIMAKNASSLYINSVEIIPKRSE